MLNALPASWCDNAQLSLMIYVGWSTQQVGLTSCIYLNGSLQKGLQFTSYNSIIICLQYVIFFPLFTNVGPYLIRLRVRSWESHKGFTNIFLLHNVNCKLHPAFRHGPFWAAGALSKKIEMDWCWSLKKIWDGIKITILKGHAANKTSCFAVQWLNFPNQAQSQKLTIFKYGWQER